MKKSKSQRIAELERERRKLIKIVQELTEKNLELEKRNQRQKILLLDRKNPFP